MTQGGYQFSGQGREFDERTGCRCPKVVAELVIYIRHEETCRHFLYYNTQSQSQSQSDRLQGQRSKTDSHQY